MSKPIFDFSDGDLAFPVSNNMAMDFNGNVMMRMGDNMAIDMSSGELHLTSPWESDDDDKDDW